MRRSPGLDLVDLHLDLQVGLAPQRARDHVAQGMAAAWSAEITPERICSLTRNGRW